VASYTVRERVRTSVGGLIGTGFILAVVVGLGFALQFGLAGGGHSGGGGPLRTLLWVQFWAMVLLALLLLYVLLVGLRRLVTQAPLVIVDGDGITLGKDGLLDRPRLVRWQSVARLRSYTVCWRPGPGEDPPLEYLDYLPVDLADGSSVRRHVPTDNPAWSGLFPAVSELAPWVRIEADGLQPEGTDPG
jgi:hypothetical protein